MSAREKVLWFLGSFLVWVVVFVALAAIGDAS